MRYREAVVGQQDRVQRSAGSGRWAPLLTDCVTLAKTAAANCTLPAVRSVCGSITRLNSLRFHLFFFVCPFLWGRKWSLLFGFACKCGRRMMSEHVSPDSAAGEGRIIGRRRRVVPTRRAAGATVRDAARRSCGVGEPGDARGDVPGPPAGRQPPAASRQPPGEVFLSSGLPPIRYRRHSGTPAW